MKTVIYSLLLMLFSISLLAQEQTIEKKIVIVKEIIDDNGKVTTEEVTLTGAEADKYLEEQGVDIENEHVENVNINITEAEQYKIVEIDDEGNKRVLEWDGEGEMPEEMKMLMDKHDIDNEEITINVEGPESEGGIMKVRKIVNGEVEEMEFELDEDGNIPTEVRSDLEERGINIDMSSEETISVTVEGEGNEHDGVREVRVVKKSKGDPNKAQLGVHIEDSENGVKVIEVVCCSPADEAGIIVGDVITKIGKSSIDNTDALINAVQEKQPGDKLKVFLSRNGDVVKKKITLVSAQSLEKFEKRTKACCAPSGKQDKCCSAGVAKENCCAKGCEKDCCKAKSMGTKHDIIKLKDGTALQCEKTDGDKKVITKKIDLNKVKANQEEEKVEGTSIMRNPTPVKEGQRGLALEELEVFPNPNQGNMRVRFNASCTGPIDINVVDLTGRKIYTRQIDNFEGQFDEEIALKGINLGTVMLIVSQGDKIFSEKIVLQ